MVTSPVLSVGDRKSSMLAIFVVNPHILHLLLVQFLVASSIYQYQLCVNSLVVSRFVGQTVVIPC